RWRPSRASWSPRSPAKHRRRWTCRLSRSSGSDAESTPQGRCPTGVEFALNCEDAMNDTGNGSAPDNPMGTDGFEFVAYTAPDPEVLGELFEQLGFVAVARHRSKDVLLYRQGRVNFIVNREPDSFAQSFARVHGPSACAFAMRVKDAAKAYKRAIELGAKPHHGKVGPM